jgi:diguanylate cyclase (GGDEF)-like protein
MERRANPRHPIHLNAIARVEGFRPCACTVRDFCVGGMFLALAPEEVATLSPPGRPLPRDTSLSVEVAFSVGGRLQTFRLAARVARVLEQGLGVAFVDPDPTALRALQERVDQTRQARRLERASAPPSASDRERARTLGAVRELVGTRLQGMLKPFLAEVDRDLEATASVSTSFVGQSNYFDARAVIRQGAARLEATFAREVMHEIPKPSERARPESAVASRSDVSVADLSLIDQADFEDMLATSEIATRAEERFRAQLQNLQRRFATLLSLPTEVSACPIGPAVVADAFRVALSELGLARKVLEVLYRTFERTVVPTLGELYDRVSALLQDLGVEAATPVKPVVVRKEARDAHPARGPRAPGAAGEGPGATVGLGPSPVTAAPLAFPGFWPGPGGAGLTLPGIALPAGGPAAEATDPADASPVRAAGVEGAAVTGSLAESTARLAAATRTVLGLARWARAAAVPVASADTLPQGPAVLEEEALVPPSEEEVLEALSALQGEPGAASDGALRARLLGRLAEGRPGARAVRLAPAQEAAFELLGGLLRSVLEDERLEPPIRSRIERLAVPLHKVAVLDEDFLQEVDHPARRLLDQIARLQPRTDVPGGAEAVWRRIDQVLDRMQREFGRDLAVLEDAAGEVDEVVEEQRARYLSKVQELVRASEEQQAVLRARRVGSAPGRAARPLPPELSEWVSQAKRLRVGDRLELGAGTPRAEVTRLVWLDDDHSSFVFANRHGDRAASLSLQEVAMQLRRGLARLVQEPDSPAVERGLSAILERVHRQLRAEAREDAATGLLTALAFEEAVKSAAGDASRRKVTHALLYLDLDRFRGLADRHGPAAADAYLAAVGQALARDLPASASVARLAGNGFGALLLNTDLAGGLAAAETARRAVEGLTFDWQGSALALTASGGVTPIAGDIVDPRILIETATTACRAAKQAGPNRVEACSAEDARVRRQKGLRDALSRLTRALEEGHRPLRAQAIVPVREDGARLPCLEVLPWIEDPDGQPVPPADLAAAAEYYEEAGALDRLVIRETLSWMTSNPEEVRRLGGCAIRLSTQALGDEGLTAYVLDQLLASRVPPGKLVFEVAEGEAMAALSSAQHFVRSLHDLGCRFALHGFGAREGSYASLKALPVDFVKIDAVFVKGIPQSPQDYAVVKSVNEIAHVMGKQTIAEHVRSYEVLESLQAIGVDFAQGLWLGEPRPLASPAAYERTLPFAATVASAAVAPDMTVRLSR